MIYSNIWLTVLREVRTKAQTGCYVGGAHPSVEWACAVCQAWGVTNGIRANSRGFTDVWLESSDRLRMALQEHGTWAGELETRTL